MKNPFENNFPTPQKESAPEHAENISNETEPVLDVTTLSDESLTRRFDTIRERLRSQILMKEPLTNQEELENYTLLSKEIDRRKIGEKNPIPADKFEAPKKMGTKEEYRTFGDGIVNAIEEKQEQEMYKFRESLGQNDEAFIALDKDAQTKFQALRKFPKDSEEYKNAYQEWNDAKQQVVEYEERTKNNIPHPKDNEGNNLEIAA